MLDQVKHWYIDQVVFLVNVPLYDLIKHVITTWSMFDLIKHVNTTWSMYQCLT
jgi:hypothetical protein